MEYGVYGGCLLHPLYPLLAQPYDIHLKERFLSFLCIVCLFFSLFLSAFSRFILTFLVYPHFFHSPFTFRIFPSASAIRRYPVSVLQTPQTVWGDLVRALLLIVLLFTE